MTLEEAIEILEKEKAYMIAHGGDRQAEALTSAIKALEQEPFMNKPCVSHKVCHEDKVKVLDKIRAEIEEVELNITYKENHKVGGTWGLRKALEIIDKYRGEV